MIHLVFQQSSVAVLQHAIQLDETLSGEVLVLNEDFAVGPIAEIFAAEGFQQRKGFWEEVQQHSPYQLSDVLADDKLKLHQLIRTLKDNSEETVWIWMGQNATDVCGYYWLVAQLKNFQGRIFILYLNNLPFLNEKGGIFYPKYLNEILPKEFLKAKRLARPITASEFEIDPDEWTRLSNENAELRVLEGGKKIAGRNLNGLDAEIKQHLGTANMKLQKLIAAVESKTASVYHPAIIVWRVKKMAEQGVIQLTGNFEKGWKDIELTTDASNSFVIK